MYIYWIIFLVSTVWWWNSLKHEPILDGLLRKLRNSLSIQLFLEEKQVYKGESARYSVKEESGYSARDQKLASWSEYLARKIKADSDLKTYIVQSVMLRAKKYKSIFFFIIRLLCYGRFPVQVCYSVTRQNQRQRSPRSFSRCKRFVLVI